LHPEKLKEITLAKAHCANTVRYLIKDQRSIKAIDIAISFGEGKATIDELSAVAAVAVAAVYSTNELDAKKGALVACGVNCKSVVTFAAVN